MPEQARPSGHPRWAGPLAALLVVVGVAYVMHRELTRFHMRAVVAYLHAIPTSALIIALCFMAASYSALCSYDVLALRYLRKKVPLSRTLSATFIANAFGYNLGVAMVTGAAFRMRLYAQSRLTATDIATLTGFTSLTTSLGLGVLAGIAMLLTPTRAAVALHVHPLWTVVIGAVVLALVALYFTWAATDRARIEIRGWLLRPPGAVLSTLQLALGTLDLSCAAAVLFWLLPPAAGIGFVSFAGAYAIAVAAGLLSHVPGGLGVFETVMVLELPGIQPEILIGALLGYRIVYYVVPLLLATLLFGLKEVYAQRARLANVRERAAAFVAPLVPSIVGTLTFIAGVVLLLAGATERIDTRLAPLTRLLPLAVVELSHLAGSIIGLALLILARALFRRVAAAYHITFWMLVAGAVASLLKGFDYQEAAVLTLVLIVLNLGHRAFYRPTSILEQRFTPIWVVSVIGAIGASIWAGLLTYRHVEYSQELWWTFAMNANAPRMLRASLVVSVLAAAYLVRNLLRPAQPAPGMASWGDLALAQRIIESSSTTLANAALTGDKHLLINDAHSAFIMYQIQRRSWIALGDPVGPRQEAEELVWRFRELSDQHGGRTVFYQASAACLPLYVDLGLTAMKIGEEARVPLQGFTLEGHDQAELRQSWRRAQRDHATFELVPREGVPALLPALRNISNAWLTEKATAEKRFSVGAFSPEYLERFPVALVRRDGEPVAFANLWPAADRDELSVDLMRFGPEAPHSAMDFLFVELMLWARTAGFRWFSLGMAPLSGLERHPLAPAWHRIGSFVFRHGEHFYNFDGLRRYKAKFHPHWEPRYLMAPGGGSLPLILMDVSTLIAGGFKELFAK